MANTEGRQHAGGQSCGPVSADSGDSEGPSQAAWRGDDLHRSIIQTAMSGFWLADTQGRILEVNNAYCRMSGYSEAELLAMRIPDLEAVESAAESAAHMARLIAVGEDRFESRHRRRDGTVYDVEISTQYLPIDGGRCVVFVRDISERKRTDAALRISEDRLNLAQEAAAFGVWDWDIVSGRIVWSPPMFTLLGLDPQTASASFEAWQGVLHPEDAELANRRIESALRDRTRLDSDYRVVWPDGQVRWIRAVGQGYYDGQGRPLRMLGVCQDVTAAAAAADELKVSEEHFRGIFTEAATGMALVSPSGRFLRANPSFCRFLGYTEAELVGRPVADVTAPGDQAQSAQAIAQALDGTEDVRRYEKQYLTKSGQVAWGEVSITALHDRHGQPTCLVAHVNDITERKRAEAALQEAEWKFRALFENGPIGVAYHAMIYDADGQPVDYRFIDANSAYLELTGVDPRGKTVREAFPGIENDPFDWIGTFGRVARTGETLRFEQYLELNRRWYDCVGYQYQPDHFVAAFLDITDRKRAEEALREVEERFRAVASSTPDHVIMHDLDLRYTYVLNPQLGLTVEGMLGKTDRDILAADEADRLMAAKRRVLATGEPLGFETSLVNANGEPEYFEGSYVPQRGHDGRVDGLIGYFRNVTERREAEDRLRASEAQFASAFEYAAIGMALVSPDGRWLRVNRATCDLLGYTPDELMTMTFQEITHPDDLDADLAYVQQLLDGKIRSYQMEKRYLHRSGVVVWAWLSVSLVRDQDGRPVHFISQIQNITDRKRAEEASRASIELLDSLARQVPGVIYQFQLHPDEHSSFPYASPGIFEMFELRPEDVRDDGRPLHERIHPEDRRRVDDLVRDSARTLEPFACEFRVALPVQGERWRWCQSQPRRTDDGGTLWYGIIADVTDRKLAEQALRDSEQQFRMLAEGLPQLVWVCQADGPMSYTNQRWVDYTGLTLDESYGTGWVKAFHPADQPRLWEAWQRAIQFDEPPVLECRLRRADGVYRSWLIRGVPMRNAEGKVQKWVGTCTDIEDIRQAEQDLRESEQQFRMLAEGVPQLVWMCQPDGLNIYFNRRWVDYTGLTLEESYGTGWVKPFHPGDQSRASEAWQRATASGEPYVVECRLRRADGAYRWWLIRGVPMRNAEGEVLKWVGTCTDIEDIRQAEEALRESEHRFRAIVQGAQAVVFVLDKDGRFELSEGQALRSLGLQPGQLVGLSALDVYQDYPDVVAGLRAALRGEARSCLVEVQGLWFDTLYTPRFDADGRPAGAYGIATDVTEHILAEQARAQLADQMAQSQKLESVGRLAGGVAHDFNNMLAVILGHIELALEEVDPTQPLHEDLLSVQEAARRSADLTRQLLAYARRQTVERRVLDLNETVSGMLRMLNRLIGEDIALVWQPAQELWSVHMDPSQLDQILTNLCVNARDAIGGVGRIVIETSNAQLDDAWSARHPGFAAGDYVRLALSDTGIGMDEATLSQVFEPFFTTKGLGRGTGLGLATVYGIVKQNGGLIEATSEPGVGSQFAIYLPRHGEAVTRPADGAPADVTAPGYETILLVEDEPEVLRLAVRQLQRQGYTVLATGSPLDALRLAGDHAGRIDLLLTDVVMPEMNGRELAATLVSRYPRLRCLYMSGYPADVVAERGVLDAGTDFLPKPFTVKELSAKVREVLGRE